jgi:23S rRNA pseudouridine1911/1915/1917 synthase
MRPVIRLAAHIPPEQGGRRLDQALADLFPQYSRSRLQQWLKSGQVRLDQRLPKAKERVLGGEHVVIEAEPEQDVRCEAEAIPLDVVYGDEDLLVINKPAGLVVHPAAGNPAGTLQNALLHLDRNLQALPRAGIVHRLDKDTSGLMVVARSLEAHKSLVDQLQARTLGREYLAVVNRVLPAGGTVDAPIGRHPVDRKRMAVVAGGKPAITHYRVLERYRGHSLIQVRLETGRTHQIRVHMAHIHCPLVGDPVYGGRPRLPRGAGERLRAVLSTFPRQALHATRLSLRHPRSGEPLSWEVPPPEDLVRLLEALRRDVQPEEAT